MAGHPTLADASLDWITYNAHRIKLKGESLPAEQIGNHRRVVVTDDGLVDIAGDGRLQFFAGPVGVSES